MRLAEFIRREIEPILQNWESFAKSILSADDMDKTELRDHAKDMLLIIADDLETSQSESEQSAKAKGRGHETLLESGANVHGGERQSSGFSVSETVSEFRALRASVVSLWITDRASVTSQELEDLTRFHEAIDQAVAESLENYEFVKDRESRLYGTILGTSPFPIYVLDLEGRITYANSATADLFALDRKSIIGQSSFELGFTFASEFQRNLEKVIEEQAIYHGKLVHTFLSNQGERYEYLLAPVLDRDRTDAVVCIFQDVTERVLAEERIWHSAHHDLLTGLPNRRLFMDRLEQEVNHANRKKLPFSLLFMDLDGFKEINDSLGHEAGDQILTEVAKRLSGCVRKNDTIARLGGDEFAVILSDADQPKCVELVAQKFIDELAKPFEISQQLVQVSVSIGITFSEEASSPAALLRTADHAMYEAKRSGANRIWFNTKFDSESSGLSRRQ